jgi:hypothetical protein
LKANEEPNVKQVAVLERNGNVVYGAKDVDRCVTQNPKAANRTLRLWKMNMIPHFRHHEQVRHNRKVLYGKRDAGYLRDFLTDHFRCILDDVRSFYKRELLSDDPGECDEYYGYIDSLPIELQIPVPVLMDDDGRADMRIAARLAGATDVELREEPLCVATCYMLELVKYNRIAEGQCILVFDVGGGTADVASVRLVELPTPGNGDSLVMQRVGLCNGNGAGAHCLEAQAEQWAKQQPWFEEKCHRLQISEYNFLCQLSKGMENVKRDFYDEQRSYTIMIRSSHGNSGRPLPGFDYDFPLSIPRTTIQEWYNTWIDQAKDLLRDHLSTREHHPYALAILSGGGSKSPFFRSETSAFLEQEHGIRTPHSFTVALPCSRGGLTQHVLQEDSLPDSCYWYIAQSEPYDSKRHRDAKRIARLRQESVYVAGEILAHDRLIGLMSYTTQQGFQPRRPLLQRFTFEVGPLGRLHLVCYWSEKRRAEHSSVYDLEDKRKPGLRSYPVMFDLPDLRLHHFPVHYDGRKRYHLVFAFIEMHGGETSLCVTATIMKPTFSQKDSYNKRNVWQTFTDEIWTPSSSPFVSQHTGPTGARCHSGYQDNEFALPTTESRSQRLRIGSVFTPEYGSADSSDDETVQGFEAEPTRSSSARADDFIVSTRSLQKRAREEPQSPQGRRRSGRLLVRQKFSTTTQSFYSPSSIYPVQQDVATPSSQFRPSVASPPSADSSLDDTPSLDLFRSPDSSSSPEPVYGSFKSTSPSAVAFPSGAGASPNVQHVESDVLLRKCE